MDNFQKIRFQCRSERLDGTIFKTDISEKPTFLFLHGAGISEQSRSFYLMEGLQKNGVSSMSFDFSGHGKSSGSIENSSLKKRVEEAHRAFEYLSTDGPIAVCGSSMAGHIAIKMLEKSNRINSLILFVPAVYDRRAYSVPFNKGFTSIIRENESWKNSEALSLLDKFKGNLLMFLGENDEVIPQGVIDLLDEHSQNTRKKEIVVIPDCSHRIYTHIGKRPQLADEVVGKILEFV